MPESVLPTRAFQWDLARQVERLDWLLDQLPRYADWGYQELYLHLEDAVEYPSLPGIARRDAYTHRQLATLVQAADRAGLKVVPIVNLLGHTQYLIKHPDLRDLNELRHPDGSPQPVGQICPVHPRTLEVAGCLLDDMVPFCTAGKVHVGLDESFHLGRHPRSQQEIERIGLAAHFARYVRRLHRLAGDRHLQMGMWADMLYFLPDAIALLPRGLTAYEWYYHAFPRWPRVELFNFAEVDIATPLRRRGIAMYGCPMNGAARYEPLPHFHDRLGNALAWWRHARRIQAQGFLMTSWEPYRLAIELTTVIDAANACLWLEPEVTEPAQMLARGFERVFGRRGAKAAARLALAADKYPFGGYPRWQINERWDTLSRREPLHIYRKEQGYCATLHRRARASGVPVPLRASLAFRHYLAQRDVFVRRAARGLATAAEAIAFRRALTAGRKAARTMWLRSRRAGQPCPNLAILEQDAALWNAWRKGQSVFGGAWQLCYQIRNDQPGAQEIAVEQWTPKGTWVRRQSCYTIEFQTWAAQPRCTVVREHAAPVEWDGDPRAMPRLRFTSKGPGRVSILHPVLTNGRTPHAIRLRRQRIGLPLDRRQGWQASAMTEIDVVPCRWV